MNFCSSEDVLNLLKARKILAGQIEDEIALGFIEQGRIKICSYCNLPFKAENLPEEMIFAWAEMSSVLMKNSGGDSGVSSIKQGDTTIDFLEDSSGSQGHIKRLLQDFRRLP